MCAYLFFFEFDLPCHIVKALITSVKLASLSRKGAMLGTHWATSKITIHELGDMAGKLIQLSSLVS